MPPPTESVRDMVVRFADTFEGPNDIAKAVLAELTPPAMWQACAEMLPDYCATVLRFQRHSVGRPDDDDASEPAMKGGGRSAKGDAIREWYPRFLAQQLHVAGCWKRFGDCTVADLTFAVGERESQAAATLHRARELKEVAAALTANRKRRVADLPEPVLRAALERAK